MLKFLCQTSLLLGEAISMSPNTYLWDTQIRTWLDIHLHFSGG